MLSEKQRIAMLMDLLALDGVSGEEHDVADYIVKAVRKAGVPAKQIFRDNAHKRSPRKGTTGNIIINLPGTIKGPRTMFSAHIDTVELARGSRPVRKGRRIISAGNTALGADDRSGTAVLLATIIDLQQNTLPHPPLTFLFSVQEEIGLFGTRFVNRTALKKPVCCYNFDGSQPGKMILSAPSAVKFDIKITGLAAHAGVHPDHGVSAALIFAKALERIHSKGLFGEITRRGKRAATSNIGVVQGGTATNVIMDTIIAHGEARSYNEKLLQQIIKGYKDAFAWAAASVKNHQGTCGSAKVKTINTYHTFTIPKNTPAVKKAVQVLKTMGQPIEMPRIYAGLDANWLCSYGIPTITLGAGEENPHTVGEVQNLDSFIGGCDLAMQLAGG